MKRDADRIRGVDAPMRVGADVVAIDAERSEVRDARRADTRGRRAALETQRVNESGAWSGGQDISWWNACRPERHRGAEFTALGRTPETAAREDRERGVTEASVWESV